MAESFIQLPPDSTGKQLRTETGGPNAAHMEVHVLADADGTLAAVSTLAKTADVTDVTASLGSDGGTPPASGTGVRGWLRGIYDRLGGTLTVNNGQVQPLTDAQLRATAVPVSGTVTVSNPTAQGLTDTQLRATAVPVSGTVSTGLTQPLTDAQLRASAVPVSGTVTANTGLTQPLTDTQLRAAAVSVSATAMTDGTQKSRITNGTVESGVEPFGALQVNNGFQTLFYDAWDVSPIDTTDKWTITGTAPTIATGAMTMPATVSTYNAIRTKDTIRSNVGFTLVRNGFSIETTTTTGAGRFWGLGTPATTPAAAVLVQDGIGFELDQASGSLLAVTYANGARTTVATLTRPTDGLNHAYGLYFRVTQAYWTLDGVTVASLSFPNVQVAQLPALIVRQNAASFTGTPLLVNIAHLTADTSRQGTVIADPVIGTRMARVGADGTLKVSGTGTAGTPATSVQTVQGITGGTALPVSGTFFQATQPVSATALPLPSGASTETTLAALSAKLPTAAALADALVNPALSQVQALNSLFNGSTWDRQRGMSVATTTGDTGAKTATGVGSTQTNAGNKGVSLFIILGTVSGVTPTCVFKVQGSVDGTNFFDIPGAATASLTTSLNVGIQVFPGVAVTAGAATTGTTATASQVLPRFWRMAWTLTGTTPSYTITSITYNYLPY